MREMCIAVVANMAKAGFMKGRATMIRRTLLIAAVMLLAAGAAQAQCNPDQDEICIVFDPPSCCENCIQAAFGQTIDLYFVLQNPSAAGGILGYEFDLCNINHPEYLVVGYTFPGGVIPIVPPPPVVIGFGTPLPAEPCVILMIMRVLALGSSCWCTGVQPWAGGSVPGEMIYVDGGDPMHYITMKPCTGPNWPSCSMACVNCAYCPPDPPIDVQSATWGQMKALYR
jgi:hypothetical protein